MRFDWTLTFGTVLQIVSMVLLAVAVFNAVSARLSIFENTLKDHAASLARHADRLDRYDSLLLKVVGDLQRVVGQSDILRTERRGHPRD